jgi:hypothetical protein
MKSILFPSCVSLLLLACLPCAAPAATTPDTHTILHKADAMRASEDGGRDGSITQPIAGVAEPIPPMLRPQATPPDPTTPPARTFHDSQYGVSFTVPTAWDVTRTDSSVSTFNLDARSAVRATKMRAVATIGFNPHPTSTFSGALFYFSVTPNATPAECSNQATAQAPRKVTIAKIGGIPFNHGYDQHGVICTEARDEIYTAPHDHACYRFDLVINTYCGGDVSGVRDITPDELNSVRNRMQAILDSVHFDK